MNLLPAVESYIIQRMADLNKYYRPFPKDRWDELETVLTLVRGLQNQATFLEKTLEVPRKDSDL